jgi:predicted neuraminidase
LGTIGKYNRRVSRKCYKPGRPVSTSLNIEPGFAVILKAQNIEARKYSDPNIMQGTKGHIYVVFTYHRQTIKIVSFDEDRIKHGGTLGEY